MSKAHTDTDDDRQTTDVYHDGREVAVRATTRFSRGFHTPATDDDGAVILDEDDRPRPECGAETVGKWKLVPLRLVENRDKCNNCHDDAETISERNSIGVNNQTLGRLAQKANWQGEESLSANASHTSDD